MKILRFAAMLLAIIGALNWGLVALGYNLVDGIFGYGTTASQLVYALIGFSGLFGLFSLFRSYSCCWKNNCKCRKAH